MSYVFDTLASAWAMLREELPEQHRDGEIAVRFGFLMEEMHDANHRLKDAVNKDARVTSNARMLQRAIAKATGEQA